MLNNWKQFVLTFTKWLLDLRFSLIDIGIATLIYKWWI